MTNYKRIKKNPIKHFLDDVEVSQEDYEHEIEEAC